MENKTVELSLSQLLLTNETALKIIVANGFDVIIPNDNNKKTTTKVVEPTTTKVVENKTSSAEKKSSIDNKKTSAKTKSKDKKTSNKSKDKTSKLAVELSKCGKGINQGDYYAVVKEDEEIGAITGTVIKVGYAKEVDTEKGLIIAHKNDNTAVYYSFSHCFAIDYKTFKSYRKLLKATKTPSKEGDSKVSSTKKLATGVYLVANALHLLELGKISKEDFEKAKTDQKFCSELYHKFKEDKVSSSEAKQIVAKHSSKELAE